LCSRIERPCCRNSTGLIADGSGKSFAYKRFEPLFGLGERLRVTRFKKVSGVATVIHYDLGRHSGLLWVDPVFLKM